MYFTSAVYFVHDDSYFLAFLRPMTIDRQIRYATMNTMPMIEGQLTLATSGTRRTRWRMISPRRLGRRTFEYKRDAMMRWFWKVGMVTRSTEGKKVAQIMIFYYGVLSRVRFGTLSSASYK